MNDTILGGKKRKLRPSEFTEKLLVLQGGDKFEFQDPIMRTIYDTHYKWVLLRTGRQIAKSTTIANKMVYWGCMLNGFKNLYVSSSETQTKQFSQDRLTSALKSPKIAEMFFTEKDQQNNVYFKRLNNDSTFRLHHCYVSADRIRGQSADGLCIDEIQDITTDEIPVIEETLFRSKFKYKIYCGTPKTEDSCIEYYWNLSTRTEYEIYCTHCNKFNYIDQENISEQGLVCRYPKCKKPISGMDGTWVHYTPKAKILGFRIPQIVFPWVDWEEEIWTKMHTYSTRRFYNEKLALPYDVGEKPVTREEVIACCDSGLSNDYQNCMDYLIRRKPFSIMTLDWGGGENSFSVKTIMAERNGKMAVVHTKKYRGLEADPEFILRDVVKTVKDSKGAIEVVGADFGYGFGQNSRLATALFEKTMFVVIQSVAQSTEWTWDKTANRFKIDRTMMLGSTFAAIKDHKVVFPDWEEFEPFAEDILAEYIDYTNSSVGRGRMYYDHPANKPDDVLQTIALGYLLSRIHLEMDFYNM